MFQQVFKDLPLILDYTNFSITLYFQGPRWILFMWESVNPSFYNQKGSAVKEKQREKSKTTNKRK